MNNPPHPGEGPKALCLEPLELTVTAAAKALGVSRKTLSAIVNGGLIRKTAGTGTSVVIGTYSQVGAGAVRVDSGTLSVATPMVAAMSSSVGARWSSCTGASSTAGFSRPG